MEWILDNFGKLLPVVLAVLYFWLNSKKRRPNAEEAEESDGSDENERARRIQEEIRRRILERQQGGSPAPQVEPPVLVGASLHQAQERQVRPTGGGDVRETEPNPIKVPQPQRNYQDVLKRQAQLAQRYEGARRMAEVQKASGMRTKAQSDMAKRIRSKPEVVTEMPANPLRAALLRDLKGGAGLRRAVLLREILGDPVGLKRGSLPQK